MSRSASTLGRPPPSSLANDSRPNHQTSLRTRVLVDFVVEPKVHDAADEKEVSFFLGDGISSTVDSNVWCGTFLSDDARLLAEGK